jgi:SAM-dependent methyltransferase
MPATDPDYYDLHADAFVAQTVAVDMAPLHQRFLAHLPARAKILDAGCGSGRDARAFLERGHEVVAIDGSAEMVRRASRLTGLEVLQLRFEELAFVEAFDGIWASASLLHVPQRGMAEVSARFVRALRPGGIWYMSFKLGRGERVKGGRLFNDQDEASLAEVLRAFPGVQLIAFWRTGDRRPGRTSEIWLNGLVRRTG